jgi:hypothetical protein
MKRLLLAVALATIFAVPNAHAVFEGVLQAGLQTTISLSPTGTTGGTAIATVFVARKSKFVVLGTLTAAPLGSAQLDLPSLPKSDRLFITVNAQAPITLHVVQGTVDNTFQVSGDGDFVYNVTP